MAILLPVSKSCLRTGPPCAGDDDLDIENKKDKRHLPLDEQSARDTASQDGVTLDRESSESPLHHPPTTAVTSYQSGFPLGVVISQASFPHTGMRIRAFGDSL